AAQRERRERKREAGAVMDSAVREQRGRRMAAEFQELAVVRAALSERQLYEVMVDFWTNHFNVFLGKGADRFLMPDYIEHTIREHAMGKFEDLLIATAKSPAMMFYLDNWQSAAVGCAGGEAPGATLCQSLPPRAPHRGAELGTRNAEQSDPRSFRVPTSAFPVGAQRELRPRAARAPHPRRGRRLHLAGRDRGRPGLHWVEPRSATAGRRLPIPRVGA